MAVSGQLKGRFTKGRQESYTVQKGKEAGQIKNRLVMGFTAGMREELRALKQKPPDKLSKVAYNFLRKEGKIKAIRTEQVNKIFANPESKSLAPFKVLFLEKYGAQSFVKNNVAEATREQLLDAFKKAQNAKDTEHVMVKRVLDQTGKVKKQLHFGAGELSRTLFKKYTTIKENLEEGGQSKVLLSEMIINDLKKAGVNEQRALTILGSTQKMGEQGQALAMAFMDTFGAKAYADLYSSEKVKNKAGSLRKEIYERIQHPERYGLVGKTDSAMRARITELANLIKNAKANRIALDSKLTLDAKVRKLEYLAKIMGIKTKVLDATAGAELAEKQKMDEIKAQMEQMQEMQKPAAGSAASEEEKQKRAILGGGGGVVISAGPVGVDIGTIVIFTIGAIGLLVLLSML